MDHRNKAYKSNFGLSAFKPIVLMFVCFGFDVHATEKPFTANWTSNPFEQKVFIENKGQFNGKASNVSEKILFGCSNQGVQMYFSVKGLTYRYDALVPMTEREKEAAEEKGIAKEEEEEEGARAMKVVPQFLVVEWLGANPQVEIISEEQVSNYYTYGGDVPTLKASAYKKIIYKNMYPGIDVEYVFPKDSSGIKYSLILHPGADATQIKMKYSDAKNISLSAEGNIEIKSLFGNFTDHAPLSFQQNDHSPISSSFAISGNKITFDLGAYDHSQTVVIDPWTTNPVFSGYNSAFDINYDLAGNVYVYGSTAPFQLVKLNSAGAIQWTFNATGFGFYSGFYFYGDFAMDEVNGTSYLVEGLNNNGSPCRVFKVNSSGVQTGTFAGNPNMTEMWRAEYNRCINQIVITGSDGGGAPYPPFSYQAATLDTGFTGLTPYNVLGALPNEVSHDMVLLAVEKSGSFSYMGTTRSYSYPNNFDNVILKSPLPLAASVFTVPDRYKLQEGRSINYVPYAFGFPMSANGLNGMAVSPNYLYTYDSDSLKRWDKNSGAYIAGLHAAPIPATFISYPPGLAIQVRWAGLSADDCDNIYAGVATSIKKYNTSLALTNTFILPDTVNDVKVGPNNKLYACGKGFVTEITNISPNTPTVTVTNTPASGCNACNGTATVNIVGGCNPGPYTYTWMPGGQTTQTATALCPGHYTVTIATGCAVFYTDTVTITGGSATISTTLTSTPGGCNTSGSATISVSGGTAPYSYSWTPSGQTTATASGLGGGTYSVTVTDSNNCAKTDTVTITVTNLTYTLSPGTINCFGDTTSVSISVSSGTVTWNTNPVQTGLAAHGLGAGNYTGTVNSGTCVVTFSVTLTQPPPLTIVANNNGPLCAGSNPGSITLSCNTGVSWTWTGPGGFNSSNQNPVILNAQTYDSGIYTVSVTNAGGCTGTDTTFVLIYPKPTATATNNSALCAGQTLNLTGGGGTNYNWSGPGAFSSTQQNPSITNISASANGTYTLTVTDTNGCQDDTTTQVVINPAPVMNPLSDLEFCPGVQTPVIIFSSTPGGTASSFFWVNSSTAIGLAGSGTGNLPSFTTVNSSNAAVSSTIMVHAAFNGCTGPDSLFTITIDPDPIASFSAQGPVCEGAGMLFTDHSAGTITQWNWDMNNDGIFTDATSSNPTFTFATAGTHTVGLIVTTNKFCLDTTTLTVYVNPTPVVYFTGDNLQGCPIVSVNFTDNTIIAAPGQISSWQWNFGNGTVFSGQFPTTVLYTNLSSTQVYSYTVSLTVTSDSGCVATNTKPNYIKVFPVPIADFSYVIDTDESDGVDATVHFTDQSTGVATVNWYLGDVFAQNLNTNYTTVLNPEHTYLYGQTYAYSVTEWVYNQYGCKDSITKVLEVKPGFTFYIPNAFSPNADGINEGFKGLGIGIDNSTYQLLIFDRWGEQIYKANDMEKAWDGRVKGKGDIVQEDVYVWKVEFRDLKGGHHEYAGTVSVIK